LLLVLEYHINKTEVLSKIHQLLQTIARSNMTKETIIHQFVEPKKRQDYRTAS
jgi:hypothetical protein